MMQDQTNFVPLTLIWFGIFIIHVIHSYPESPTFSTKLQLLPHHVRDIPYQRRQRPQQALSVSNRVNILLEYYILKVGYDDLSPNHINLILDLDQDSINSVILINANNTLALWASESTSSGNPAESSCAIANVPGCVFLPLINDKKTITSHVVSFYFHST